MGPSSLLATISPEAPGGSLPNITGSQASSIKLTLNLLIGSNTYDCERNKHQLRNIVLVSKYKYKLPSFGYTSLPVSGCCAIFFMYVRKSFTLFIPLLLDQQASRTFRVKKSSKNGPSNVEAVLRNERQSDKPFTQQFQVISQLRSFQQLLKLYRPLPGDILGRSEEDKFSYFTRMF